MFLRHVFDCTAKNASSENILHIYSFLLLETSNSSSSAVSDFHITAPQISQDVQLMEVVKQDQTS